MPVLNETIVKGLPIPTDKPHAIHWFSGAMVEGRAVPSGFGVSVQRSGVRSFILFYRVGQQPRPKRKRGADMDRVVPLVIAHIIAPPDKKRDVVGLAAGAKTEKEIDAAMRVAELHLKKTPPLKMALTYRLVNSLPLDDPVRQYLLTTLGPHITLQWPISDSNP